MANYNCSCKIVNNTKSTIILSYVGKGTDEDPSAIDHARNGELYHGEIVSGPDTSIAAGATGYFSAKSTGATIQGTVCYKVPNESQAWLYFHVPDLDRRHNTSKNSTLFIQDNSMTWTIS